MHVVTPLLLLGLGLQTTLAIPTSSSDTHFSLHQKRDTSSSARSPWIKRSRVERTARFPVRIALAQGNLHQGADWVQDVSDPASPNYGQHWTETEVNRAFAPSHETQSKVVNWLTANGVSMRDIKVSDNRGWVQFEATAADAEALFRTSFHEHEHETSGRTAVACDEYYLPTHLFDHVDYVTPGVVPAKMRKSKRDITKRQTGAYKPKKTGPKRVPKNHPKPPTPKELQQLNQNPPPPYEGIPADLANCTDFITAPCVRALYRVPLPSGTPNPNNTIGVFEEDDTYSQEDLDLYFSNLFPTIPNGTHPTPAFIDGAVAPVPVEDAGGESDLDLTLIYPLIYPQTITLYQTDDPIYAQETLNGTLNGFLDTFLDALDGSFCTYSYLNQTGDQAGLDPVYPDPNPGGYKGELQCGVYKPTNVISASYLFDEPSLPVVYQQRQCNEWMKLTLQGHTILFASGDYGVAGFPSDPYPNGTCIGDDNQIFNPSGPSTCPYILSVGATQLQPNGSVFTPEEAANTLFGSGAPFTSSGGFSNIFPIPDYQTAAVAQYFATSNPPFPYYETLNGTDIGANGGIYNRIGRGFPDISAVGAFWLDFVNGEETGYGGTSMACPIVASIINRIVEERLKVGKGPLGFIHPALYANANTLLHDITLGNNIGCGQDPAFETAVGWDPVTGLGTPNYPAMLKYFLSLP